MAKVTFKPKQTTKKLLRELKDRARDVIVQRYGLEGGEKSTLQAIGNEYNITRERVRQIENAALRAIRESDSFQEAQTIFGELKNVLNDLGGVVEEDHLLKELSDDEITQNHMHFYLVLGDDFIKHKESKKFRARWSVGEGVAEKVHSLLDALHDLVTDDEILEEKDMLERFLSHELASDLPEDHRHEGTALRWLKISNTLDRNPLGHWGRASSPHIKTRGIRDLAYLVMRDHGSPMHFREVAEQISDRFGRPTHVATCHNELIKDSRFVLVGRGMYGLKEWGYRTGTAREIISNIIKEEGRPMSRDEIVDKVMRERFLKKNTILVNLQNPKHFKKDSNGLYTLV